MQEKPFSFVLSFLSLVVLILVNRQGVSACEFFETRRTCECKAMYTIGGNMETIKVLFDLASYDDCGVNLGCEKLDCATRCANSIRKLVGGAPEYVTDIGKESLCKMIAPLPNDIISMPGGIGLYASWKYSTCRSGLDLIVQDVCCNRKCDCKLVNQDVKTNNVATQLNVIQEYPIIYGQQMYQCRYNESDECHLTCLDRLSGYFADTSLTQLDDSQLNMNYFANNPSKSKRVCEDLNKPIGKPGTDVYVQSYTQALRSTSKYTNLGRLCCASPCKCEYIFQFAQNNTSIDSMSVPIVDDVALNLGYECSDELSDCISYCRKIAFISIDINDVGYVKKDTTQRTDVFYRDLNSQYSQYICKLIGDSLMDDHGFSVYLRYSASRKTPDEFPYREDIHIGRLCCDWFPLQGGIWLPVNRCNKT